MNDFISTNLSAVCSGDNHPVRITIFEISLTDLDFKYVQNYVISTAAQAFKVYFYQYGQRKLHGCYTLKKVNTSVKSLTKVLLINLKGRVILSINKQ